MSGGQDLRLFVDKYPFNEYKTFETKYVFQYTNVKSFGGLVHFCCLVRDLISEEEP